MTKWQATAMDSKDRKYWIPFAIFAVVLLAWAGMFALGAYLEWGADQPRHDVRKPLIVLGSMVVFLALWGAGLWFRARKRP